MGMARGRGAAGGDAHVSCLINILFYFEYSG